MKLRSFRKQRGFLLNPFRFGSQAAHYIALPLTYDEQDADGALTWTRQGNGPHVTPEGMCGDGYEARYLATTGLPAWLTAGAAWPLTVHASVTPAYGPRNATRDTVLFVGDNDATANPKLEICIVADERDAAQLNVALRSYTTSMQTKYLFRREWQYGFRFPELSVGGEKIRPQGVLFIDADTLLISGHYNDTLSRVYKIDVATFAVLGYFDFAAPYVHVASIAERASDGSYWFGDFATGALLRVDIASSFASNVAVIDLTYDCSVLSGFGGVEWIDISGTEYLLAVEYLTTGTPYLYVIPGTEVVDAGTFATDDRLKRFVFSQRTQGINFEGGKLFASMNRLTGESVATGKLQRYDIVTAIASLADGGTITAEQTWDAPSQYPQDIDFHPTTGEIWTQTEGRMSVIDEDGYLSAWHRSLDATEAENHITAEYNGAGSVTIKLNGEMFEVMAWTPSVTPAAVSVGGPPSATAGQQNGFFLGAVRDIVLSNSQITDDVYQDAISGAYEPNTLTVHTITLTNAGADIDVTGWTNEVGSIARRTSNPNPYSGAGYFSGGSNLQTISRERFSVETVTGLTGVQIDAATMWARVEWRQASFGGTDTDTATVGLRCLDVTPTQQTLAYAGLLNMTPVQTWIPRGLAASIPASCRNLDVLYRSDRSAGTNNDGYVDELTLKIYQQ